MEDSEIVVVTQESRKNRPEGKIPYVCNKKGIKSINLLEFIEEIMD